MYEYKVLTVGVNESEKTINDAAREGWRLIQVISSVAAASFGRGIGVVIYLERVVEK